MYAAARRVARERGRPFSAAKLFWWFNQGAAADWSLTPKPWYGCDGDKRFGIAGTPADLADRIQAEEGPFPFTAFWGPEAGVAASRWIARATARILRERKPTLALAYLPHLDYDLQRFGVLSRSAPAAG